MEQAMAMELAGRERAGRSRPRSALIRLEAACAMRLRCSQYGSVATTVLRCAIRYAVVLDVRGAARWRRVGGSRVPDGCAGWRGDDDG